MLRAARAYVVGDGVISDALRILLMLLTTKYGIEHWRGRPERGSVKKGANKG